MYLTGDLLISSLQQQLVDEEEEESEEGKCDGGICIDGNYSPPRGPLIFRSVAIGRNPV